MLANWFSSQFPPSRFAIEGELRSSCWRAGLTGLWLTCTRDEPPYECQGLWHNDGFTIQWNPADYFMLKTKEPKPELLTAFERLLKHRATAAYRNGGGSVVVEWRARNAEARLKELASSGVTDLETFT